MDDAVRIIHGDCVQVMATMDEASVDAIVCDPPYGLEFMGKGWDSFGGDAWRSGAGFTKPGIGERKTAWPSFGSGDSANATCATCGGRMRGANRCECDEPDWRVKGKTLDQRGNGRVEQMRAFQSWTTTWATEAYRVLKPGGHLLAFGGTRVYHRLTSGIEDAGFEIRDCIAWLYGSGFPKSMNVAKAIDEASGAVGGRGAMKRGGERLINQAPGGVRDGDGRWGDEVGRDPFTYIPGSAAGKSWDGWGTALKPAFEPIVVARKPLVGTVAANVLEYGTGALNIDAGRVAGPERPVMVRTDTIVGANSMAGESPDATASEEMTDLGRWPANLVLDEEAAAMLDDQSGDTRSGDHPGGGGGGIWSESLDGVPVSRGYGDAGGASRFFYVAKASRSERNAGLDGFEKKAAGGMAGRHDGSLDGTVVMARNTHPTVKPIDLMRHLVKLVTPPGGLVLDPFMGSGTTGCAAVLDGFRFVGIDRDDEGEYIPIARARIVFWQEHGEDGWRIVRERDAGEAKRERVKDSGQLDMFDLFDK